MYVHAYQRYSRNSVSAQLVEQSVFSQPLKMKTWNVWQALNAFWLATHRLCFLGGLIQCVITHYSDLTENIFALKKCWT